MAGSGIKQNFETVKDLNLRPDGKESFDDFVSRKKPRDNQEKFPVVVYWLKDIAGHTSVSKNHIGTVFRFKKEWREPTNLTSALSVCQARKGTIDVSNSADIKLTTQGRNFVDHDLPALPKKAK